jgi:hypothetical protein
MSRKKKRKWSKERERKRIEMHDRTVLDSVLGQQLFNLTLEQIHVALSKQFQPTDLFSGQSKSYYDATILLSVILLVNLQ